VPDIVEPRMHLAGEVRTAHRIEIVEANGEVASVPGGDRLSKHRVGFLPEEVVERALQRPDAIAQQDPVLRRDQLERPGIVWLLRWEAKLLFHPLAAPGARREP